MPAWILKRVTVNLRIPLLNKKSGKSATKKTMGSPNIKISPAKYWKARNIDGLECLRTCNIQHQYSLHCHSSYAIGVIENGVGVNEYNQGRYVYPAGDIVVMNPEVAHTGSSLEGTPLSYRMFYIESQVFTRVLPEHCNQPFFPDRGIQDYHWASTLLNLHKSIEENRFGKLENQIRFDETMSAFVEQFSTPGMKYKIGTETYAVKQIKKYLVENYQEDITIDDLVRISNLNRHYLIRAFKKSVGIPPYTYLNQIRVEHAKDLLKSGMPAADVAAELSFTDQSHLTRHFKRITGITPKKYLKSH